MRAGSRGFTLIWVMAALVLVSLGLAQLGPRWTERVQREREQELLRVGQLYAQAAADYRRASPGTLKQYPPSLEHLLEDPRYPGLVRHLRRLYPDPLNPGRPWGLVRDKEGGIMGVYSQGEELPFLQMPMVRGSVHLPAARHYREWRFVSLESVQP